MPASVILKVHDPEWPRLAEEAAAAIRAALAGQVAAVHHVGSTAIPTIKAKPIVDLLVVVRDVTALDGDPQSMAALGYEARGEAGIPGRRFFIKDIDGVRTQHVHCFAEGNPEIERHLLFRDYLLQHPEEAAEYERVKVGLAERFRDDREAYTDGKTAFIQRIDALARTEGEAEGGTHR